MNKETKVINNKQLASAFNTIASVCSVYKGVLQDHQAIQASLNVLKEKLELTNEEIASNIEEQTKESETK